MRTPLRFAFVVAFFFAGTIFMSAVYPSLAQASPQSQTYTQIEWHGGGWGGHGGGHGGHGH